MNRWSRARALALLSIALSLPAAAADAPPRAGRLYVSQSLLLGSTQLVALGGSFVGIAEGGNSLTSNLASIANRKASQADPWSLDLALSYRDLPLGNPQAQDLDNDGTPDDARQVRQFLFGLAIQLRNFGVGGYSRSAFLRYCIAEPCDAQHSIATTVVQTTIAGAVALFDDQLVLAAGIYSATGELSLGADRWSYGRIGLTFDALYRPVDRHYRIGFAFKPQVVARLAPDHPLLGGLAPFAALASPLTVSVGGSMRLGPGSERYNQLSVFALRERGVIGPDYAPKFDREDPPGRWLLTAQLDLLAPVTDAVPIRAFLEPAAPTAIARDFGLAPRVGVEHETWPGRLRLRGGAFLESSPFADHPARLHGTGGFEVFLFHYLDDLSLSVAFDVAERYSNLGISIGLWR